MRYNANTPEGTRDRLFAECRERRRVQGALTRRFRQRGYAEIITPEVEFYDLFLQSGSPVPQESMLKIIDRSGRICVMRPDCTTPIARVAATKLRELGLPQRLYYDQTIFRSDEGDRGGSSEIAQCGVELIGAAGARADAEVVALAVDALRDCGLRDFHVELGHVGFFRSLAEQLRLDPEREEEMRQLIESKNFPALDQLLQPYEGQPAWAALRRLSRLFGDVTVLDEACRLTGGNGSLDYLRAVYRELEAAGYGQYLRFDLGLVHRIDYYTGLIFRGYAEGYGAAVLSGGRYDRLVEAFGRPAQATGFAVDVDGVSGCLPPEEPTPADTLIHYAPGCLGAALAAMDRRAEGSCQLSPFETESESRALAAARGMARLLLVDGAGEREVTL